MKYYVAMMTPLNNPSIPSQVLVPSSVVAFSPNNMLEVPAPNIAGASVTNATFALVNQNGEDLSTLNEQWQLVVEIGW